MTSKIAYLSQSELADIVGVDRTTVGAWQREGMPYESQGRGKPGRYIAPVCINWWAGREFVRKLNLKITNPRMLVLLGHGLGMEGEPGWEKTASLLGERMGVTGLEFSRLFGVVEGILLARGLR